MVDIRKIREAMLRLSCIGLAQYQYDPAGQIFGDGPIHYMIDVNGLFLLAWENERTGTMVVNPITRFELSELGELGAEEAWTVLRVPSELTEGIQFVEIDDSVLCEAYHRMVERNDLLSRAQII